MKQNHDKHERMAIIGFILTLFLAIGALYYIWQTQQSVGLSYKGTQDLGEILFKRQMMTAEQPTATGSQEYLAMESRNGCCNYLESPQMGSQLKIDVKPQNGLCINDQLTQTLVKQGGFKVVDIENHPCPKNIAR